MTYVPSASGRMFQLFSWEVSSAEMAPTSFSQMDPWRRGFAYSLRLEKAFTIT